MQRQSTRKKRNLSSNSAQEQTQLVQTVHSDNDPLEPPDHVPLTTSQLPFFYDIIEEFSRTDWTNHQLTLAAMLAREMFSMEYEQRQLRKEGSVITTEKGWMCVNPRRNVITAHSSSILSFRRSLALHARSVGNLHNKAKSLSRYKDEEERLRSVFDDEENDDLLPGRIN